MEATFESGLRKREEQTELWRVPELGNAEVLHARYHDHRFERHAHGQFAISIIDRGAGSFLYRGGRRTAPAGSLVALEPEREHTGEVVSDEGWFYRVLYPEPALLDRVACELAGRAHEWLHFPEPVIRDRDLAAAMDRLHRALADPSAAPVERESLFFFACEGLLSRHAKRQAEPRVPGSREPRAAALAREYLEDRYAEDVSLEDLSGVTGLSRYHLIRVFKEAVGLPPHAYLTGVRLNRAKELLTAGVPVGEVAAKVGFADQSHLTRRFKGTFGVTPGRFADRSGARSA